MSAVQSMTGYASARTEADGIVVTVDMRSVNGKGLDIRLRQPAGLDALEQDLRKAIAAVISRGNVQVSISIDQKAGTQTATLDEEAFRALAHTARRLATECGIAPPTADGILAVRGLVNTGDADLANLDPEIVRPHLMAALSEALSAFVAMREAEGANLVTVLRGQLSGISDVVVAITSEPENQPDQILARLKVAVNQLIAGDGNGALDSARLHAEAAILATKADIREEIDRLNAHVKAAAACLEAGGAVGKKLDFLAQEFNRETNTICSKSASAKLTALGLDLKARIDQFREQVQNLQ